MILKQILLGIIGLSSGFGVAGGMFAVVLSIGVINRLAGKTHTAHRILVYEDSVLLGAIAGNLVSIFSLSVPIGMLGEIFFGIFSGIFAGCLAIAIAEILQVFPVLMRRLHIHKGLGIILISMALGKTLGSLLQFCLGWVK